MVGSMSTLLCEDTYFWAICQPPPPFRELPVLQFGSKSHTFEGTAAQHSLFPPRTPLHCAASCNSVHLCKQLVESGAAIFASTISDIETAADKCEEMEEGYIQCSQFLYGTWAPGCAGPLLGQGGAPRSTSGAAQCVPSRGSCTVS